MYLQGPPHNTGMYYINIDTQQMYLQGPPHNTGMYYINIDTHQMYYTLYGVYMAFTALDDHPLNLDPGNIAHVRSC